MWKRDAPRLSTFAAFLWCKFFNVLNCKIYYQTDSQRRTKEITELETFLLHLYLISHPRKEGGGDNPLFPGTNFGMLTMENPLVLAPDLEPRV